MKRLAPSLIVVIIGLVLLADYVVVNPLLGGIVAVLAEYLVLLAAAAALAGMLALVRRHALELARRRPDPVGSVLLLAGMAVVLIPGLLPGSAGAEEPAVRWVVAAVVIPLAAAVMALLPIFALRAAQRGIGLRSREATAMLLAAAVMLVLLLPLGGEVGNWLATASGLLLNGPLAALFRGLLMAIAVATAVSAARLLFAIDAADE